MTMTTDELREMREAFERIAALESCLREVRGLIEPYCKEHDSRGIGLWHAIALIDKAIGEHDHDRG